MLSIAESGVRGCSVSTADVSTVSEAGTESEVGTESILLAGVDLMLPWSLVGNFSMFSSLDCPVKSELWTVSLVLSARKLQCVLSELSNVPSIPFTGLLSFAAICSVLDSTVGLCLVDFEVFSRVFGRERLPFLVSTGVDGPVTTIHSTGNDSTMELNDKKFTTSEIA